MHKRLIIPLVIAVLAFVVHPISTSAASDGTAIGNLAESMQPGTWAELVTNNMDAAISMNDSIFEFSNNLVWDPASKRAYFLGSSDPQGSGGRHVQYDAVTNTWSVLTHPFWYPTNVQHGYQHGVVVPSLRKYYHRQAISNNREFYEWDIDNPNGGPNGDGWTRKANISGLSFAAQTMAGAWFPDRGTVVYCTPADVGSVGAVTEYNPATDTWNRIGPYSLGGVLHPIAVYIPAEKAVIFGGGNSQPRQLYRLDANGAITQLGQGPGSLPLTLQHMAYSVDPASSKLLAISSGDPPSNNDKFWEYDAALDRWTEIPGGTSIPPVVGKPNINVSFQTVMVGVPTYGVVMVAQWRASGSKVWLYKHGQQVQPNPPTGLQVQ
jgi:hypothetical protein